MVNLAQVLICVESLVVTFHQNYVFATLGVMDAFLQAVDDVPPSTEVLKNVTERFKSEGILLPASLAGVTDADVDKGLAQGSLAVRAFAKRAVWASTEVEKAKRVKTSSGSSSQATVMAQPQQPNDCRWRERSAARREVSDACAGA